MRIFMSLLTVLVATTIAAAETTGTTVVATESGKVFVANLHKASTPYYGCQTYHRQYVAPVQYHYPVQYQQPYVEPVVYPQHHVVQKVVAAQVYDSHALIVAVPVQPAYINVHATGSPYYYSASEAYQNKAYIRDTLREELRNILGGGNPAPVKTGPAPPTTSKPAPPTTSTPSVADTNTPPELQQKILAAYQGKANCLSCHGATGKAQGPNGSEFRLVVDDGVGGNLLAKLSSDKRWKIYGMSSVGAMPPAAATDASKAMEQEHLPAMLEYAAMLHQ